jgi:hypothetical protein
MMTTPVSHDSTLMTTPVSHVGIRYAIESNAGCMVLQLTGVFVIRGNISAFKEI